MTETERRLQALECQAEQQAESLDRVQGIDIKEHIADIYKPVDDDIHEGKHQNYYIVGGRGSGKSSFISLQIVGGIMQDQTHQTNAVLFRRTGATMRDSIYSQIAWAISELGVDDLWSGKVSPMEYTYLPTGQAIQFRAVDDPSKLKSLRPKRGYFKYTWFEEADELQGERTLRSLLQSTIRGGDDFKIFYSFNPPISRSHWANRMIEQTDARALTIRTTYKDMPGKWIGAEFIAEAEHLREVNEAAYKHEYEGIPVGDGGSVFPNVITRPISDSEIAQLDYIYEGIDFGFSQDPAAFLRVAYDRKTDTLIIIDEIYKLHCSNADLAAEIKERGYDKSGRPSYLPNMRLVTEEKQRIVCDSAEPKSIADLQHEGLHAVPCKKGPGSVMYGIRWLQHRKIVIDPARTPNCAREFLEYEYDRDRDGNILSSVPDKNNHCCDCLRYATEQLMRGKISA